MNENIKKIIMNGGGAPVDAVVSVPGSKSYTNRALVMAALAEGDTVLHGVSLSEDSEALVAALGKLGVKIDLSRGDVLKAMKPLGDDGVADDAVVHGLGRDLVAYKGEIDVGPAGTTMRFLTAFCVFVDGCEIVLKGSERMHERPIAKLVNALRELGADIEYLEKEGCPPLQIKGVKEPVSNIVKMDGSVSSQFFTALLLVAPIFGNGLRIGVVGEQVSKSYIDMTISGMRKFGIEVGNHDYKEYVIEPEQKYDAQEYGIEGDASGATYFLGMAAISGGKVRVMNVNPLSAQGDIRFPEILEDMGCDVARGEDFIEVHGCEKLKGVEVDMSDMPDTAQTLAVVAAFAEGDTRITGLSTLKGKETDRLEALKTELKRIGVESEIGKDFIVVHGVGDKGKEVLKPAKIQTYKDHRMAMAFAMLGVVLDGVEIEDPDVVKKSFPDFWEKLRSCVMNVNIEGT